MEGQENSVSFQLNEKIFVIFRDIMTRFAKYEELLVLGSELINGFQQGLEFLRRPPISKTSELVEKMIKSHETKRLKSYVEAGCVNDNVQKISKVQQCLCGLQDHLRKANAILDELRCLVEDATEAMQFSNYDLSVSERVSSGVHNPADYAALIGIIYSMVRQEYEMQEKIVSSLSLNSSSEELDSYCLMWSLRPFVDDQTMNYAWKLIR